METFLLKVIHTRTDSSASIIRDIEEKLDFNKQNSARIEEVIKTLETRITKLEIGAEKIAKFEEDSSILYSRMDKLEEAERRLRKHMGQTDRKIKTLENGAKQEQVKKIQRDMASTQNRIKKLETEGGEGTKKISNIEEDVSWLKARMHRAECEQCGKKCNTAWGLARHIVEKHIDN